MIRPERNTQEIFGDSAQIAGQLRRIADDNAPSDSYWLCEAAMHIEGLYGDACDMQRTIERLRIDLAKRPNHP